ncbi:MAG: prolyl oligopeptidase family serine peptidase [Nitrospira sp.]
MLSQPQLGEHAIWKQRCRAPVILGTQLARANPTRGLAIGNATGTFQLSAWGVPSGALRQLTERPTGIINAELSGDGRYVYYLDDHQGNEIGHLVRIPFERGVPQDLTPDLPPYSCWAFASNGSGSHFGLTAADESGFHAYSLETKTTGETGIRQRLFQSRKLTIGPLHSYAGEVAVVMTTERASTLQYNLLAFDTATGRQIAELWDGPGTSLELSGFVPRPGDLRLAGTSDRSGERRPFIWDLQTFTRRDIVCSSLLGEVVPIDWSPDGAHLLLCHFVQAVQHLYLYDVATGALTPLRHPRGTYAFSPGSGTYFGPGGVEIFAQWQDGAHPPQLIALNGQTGVKTRTVLAAGEVPPSRPWTSISFASSDGQRIQGWLGRPEGPGPFPTILHTHGGPEAVTTEVFGPLSQAWMDHGFAVLTINYRGSTTFGREFREKIRGDIGHWEMEDVAAARHWLVREGIAHPDQIFLTGWSYGGYNTLMGLGKWPDLWAGGMAGIAISDWAMLYEDSADTLKGYTVGFFGGTPQEKPEQYRVSSPITYAEHIKAPVLIIQGRRDTRTPARPIEVYEQRLKALGKSVDVHWFDAGHIGSGTEQDIQHVELMLKFAYRVLDKHKQ